MAILNNFRRALLALLIFFLPLGAAQAAGDFIVLCYHEVENEKTGSLTRTAVRAGDLAAQFAWLKANGYHPVSLQQILDSRRGGPALPDKALLLTFDDGKKDVYTRVFPLLKLFRFPVVVALTGHWLNVPDGGMVDYDGVPIPRSDFVSWADVREMQRSGLVEIASHSYDLHRGVLANPQGNTQPATTTRMFAEGVYETDAVYLARLRADLRRNNELIEQHTGVRPRAIVWPYGRSNRAAQELAVELGMPVGMTLEDGVNTANTPLPQLKRYLIEESPSLHSFAEAVRHIWSPDPARSVRIDPAQWSNVEEGLSRTLDELQKLSPNVTFVDPRVTRNGQQAALFPTTRLPVAADELNRIAWQIERRAGSPVFIDLPADWLGDHGLLADLARQINFAGVRIPLAPGDELALRALNVMERWCWPLRVAYAPREAVAADAWNKLRPGELLVLPGTAANLALVPEGEAGRVLFEFDPATQPPTEIARAMRRLEADGFRQFGLAGFPDAGLDAVWRNLSLRSQPLLP
jgi:biofilm PGA synthesis lipoprotein PgaB